MSVTASSSTPVRQLAWRLEADIRSRGLKPGDRYLTSTEAARMLGVSASTANRAMRVLAKRNLIESRPRRGTVIGAGLNNGHDTVTALDRIEVLLASDLEPDYASGELLGGIQQVLPGVTVQVNYLPTIEPATVLEQREKDAAEADHMIGYLAVSCPREVYRALARQSSPAVVLGSLWPDTDKLCSVDCDNDAMGRLAVERALKHRRAPIAFFPLDSWHPGDNAMLAAMMRTLAHHDLPADTLAVHSVPLDRAVVEAEMRRVLTSDAPPSAIVCRHRQFAEIALRTITDVGLKPGKDILIICDANAMDWQRQSLPYPTIRSRDPYRNTVAQAMHLLLKLSKGDVPRHLTIPVELHEPQS